MPSPLGREHALTEGSVTTSADGELVVQVFKTIADPFVGHLSFMKVLSGTFPASMSPFNTRSKSDRTPGASVLAARERTDRGGRSSSRVTLVWRRS